MFILLFSEEIIILFDTDIGLKNQSNIRSKCSGTLNHTDTVNLLNSNITVFKNGVYLTGREKYTCNNKSLTVKS